MTYSGPYYEAGNAAIPPILSLGGISNLRGKGRVTTSLIVPVSGGITLLSANPKRIAALIMNMDDSVTPGNTIALYLGSVGSSPMYLTPNGSLQIDVNFPWTGEIDAAYIGGNNPLVSVWEISLI
jgi:hypothetical protein